MIMMMNSNNDSNNNSNNNSSNNDNNIFSRFANSAAPKELPKDWVCLGRGSRLGLYRA